MCLKKRNDRGMYVSSHGPRHAYARGRGGRDAVAVAMLMLSRSYFDARMHACALLALRCKNPKREARAPVRHSIQCRLDCWTPFFLQSPAFNSIPPPACLQMQSCLDSCCSPALLHPHTSLSYSRLVNATPFSNCLHCTALYCILSLL